MTADSSPTVLAFDVNETLLDLAALDAPFEELLGDAALRPQWFAAMIQLAFVGGLTGDYVDFTTAQRAALHMTAAREVKALKPAPQPYRMVAERTGVPIADVCLIAANLTEVADALLAGHR